MRPYYIAIVGSGPSAFFAAASLLKAADTTEDLDMAVDMLEMLPTPWGLVRSGVAPDHPKIKSISKQFEKTAEDPRFRFFGNVVVGEHVQPGELSERYDAVIYAVGAQSDRMLNIPGEDLPGSIAAVDFVGWYNAHPHFEQVSPDLSGARAVVIGNGNVALDVARILLTDPDVLARTDIADHALESLRPRGIQEVVIVGRRGPLQAAFTTLELRELADLDGVDVVIDPAELDGITDEDAAAVGKVCKQNIKVLRGYADREPRPGHRRMVFRFLTSPIEIKGKRKVERIVLGRNELVSDGSGRVAAKDTGEREELPAQLVVRSVGYRGVAHARAAVRRPERDHPQRRRPNQRQPQRIRRRVDQARADRGDRDQQEGRPRHRRHLDQESWQRQGGRRVQELSGRSCRPGGRLASSTPAEAGHVGPLAGDRRFRAGRRRAARASPGQVGQPGRAVADWARLISDRATPLG